MANIDAIEALGYLIDALDDGLLLEHISIEEYTIAQLFYEPYSLKIQVTMLFQPKTIEVPNVATQEPLR